MEISGKTIGTWEGMLPFSDKSIKAKGEIGAGYNTKEEALAVARNNKGAEVVVKDDSGKFRIYSIETGSKSAFTRDHIEQTKDYPVTNITTKDSQCKNVVSFVTEDDYEAVAPSVHKNPYSGNSFVFMDKNKVSAFMDKSDKELQKVLNSNTTKGITLQNSPADIKGALEPTLKVLELYDSKAADWIRNLSEGDFILSKNEVSSMGGLVKADMIAAWTTLARHNFTPLVNTMVLADQFWDFNDLDKASILYHEYIHATDTPLVSNFKSLAGTIDNAINKTIGNKTEDKAYMAQWKMLETLGVKSGDVYNLVKYYLEDRKIGPFEQK